MVWYHVNIKYENKLKASFKCCHCFRGCSLLAHVELGAETFTTLLGECLMYSSLFLVVLLQCGHCCCSFCSIYLPNQSTRTCPVCAVWHRLWKMVLLTN